MGTLHIKFNLRKTVTQGHLSALVAFINIIGDIGDLKGIFVCIHRLRRHRLRTGFVVVNLENCLKSVVSKNIGKSISHIIRHSADHLAVN